MQSHDQSDLPPRPWPQRIRVEGDVQEPMLVEKVMPANATGAIQLEVVVGKDGTVIEVRPVSGPELLIAPAMDAVRRWKYRPTLLNGLPVEVQTVVEV